MGQRKVLARIVPVMLALAMLGLAAPGAYAASRPGGPQPRAASGTQVGFVDPAQGRGLVASQFTSRNWDGYITYVSSHGTDFDSVAATWTQPKVSCEKSNAWTVFWVGLDGWWNDTVEQGGSSARCVNSTPSYTTWWEMYPTNAIQTVFTISPGDTIKASVTYKTATATFVISVKDVTTAQSFTEDEKCGSGITCDRSSADVIAEDVGLYPGPGYYPLADYATMSFTGSKITDTTGHTGSFTGTAWLHSSVTETSGGVTYANVSSLSDVGKDFKATWKHA